MPQEGPAQNALCRALSPLAAQAYGRRKHLEAGDFPGWVVIETTSRCNLRCPICPRDRMKRKAGDMSPEIFEAVVAQLAEQDERDALHLVLLHFFGDPLMDPNIIKRIEAVGSKLPNLRKLGQQRDPMRGLSTSTNALLLSENLAQPLLESRLTWLGVSIDASSEVTYRQMHGNEKWDLLTANVQRLLEINEQLGNEYPTIGLQIIDTPQTHDEIDAFRARWQPYADRAENVRLVVKPYQTWAGQIAETKVSPWHVTTPCAWVWEMLVVCSDGAVAPCCYDMDCSLKMGTVPDQTIAEIWNGPRYRKMREKMLRADLTGYRLCQSCDNARTFLRRLLGR